MGTEGHPVFRNLTDGTKAKDLEAAAVRQHASFIVHEAVDAAGLTDKLRPRPQEQVVGIGQDDLAFHVVKFFRRKRLDCCLGPNGHEHRVSKVP